MQASQTFKTRFSNFRKVVPQISSAATRNRKENLKTHILMYSIGGWMGRANIHFSAHSIENFEPPPSLSPSGIKVTVTKLGNNLLLLRLIADVYCFLFPYFPPFFKVNNRRTIKFHYHSKPI